jgi:hypothetical protein
VKGAAEIKVTMENDSGKVALYGMRDFVQEMLNRIGLMPVDCRIDELVTSKEFDDVTL